MCLLYSGEKLSEQRLFSLFFFFPSVLLPPSTSDSGNNRFKRRRIQSPREKNKRDLSIPIYQRISHAQCINARLARTHTYVICESEGRYQAIEKAQWMPFPLLSRGSFGPIGNARTKKRSFFPRIRIARIRQTRPLFIRGRERPPTERSGGEVSKGLLVYNASPPQKWASEQGGNSPKGIDHRKNKYCNISHFPLK